MKKVLAYTTKTCPHCINAKNYMKNAGILFEERDVNENPSARDEYQKLGVQGVPTFVIGDQVVVGFDKTKIESLLDYYFVNCPSCKVKMRVPKNKGKIKVTCPKCSHNFSENTSK